MRGEFDQQLIARLNAVGIAGDPCAFADPAYVFRWGSTGACARMNSSGTISPSIASGVRTHFSSGFGRRGVLSFWVVRL